MNALHGAAVSYLVAYAATLSVVLGMLLLIAIAELSGATWFVVFRREAEVVVSALPALAVFTVPLVILPHWFWPADGGNTSADRPIAFGLRAIAYWAIWLWSGEVILRSRRRRAAVILLSAMAMTLAAIDWLMSLTPEWMSTVYGAYYAIGGMVGALALLAVLARRSERQGSGVTPTSEHFHALGKLTLAFVMFWAYLWYSQFFIIWIADVPREVTWYVVRLESGWRVLSSIVIVAGFVLPFLGLLFRAARRSPLVMSLIGGLLFVVHYADVYWVIVPGVRPHWSFIDLIWDFVALACILGLSIAIAFWRAGRRPSVVISESDVEQSLRYQAY
jgi:hypothetical protein